MPNVKTITNQEKRHYSILLPYRINGTKIEVYLQKRSASMKTLPNYFGFWGGKFEEGETAEAALSREIHEELGVDVTTLSPKLFNEYHFLKAVKNVFLVVAPEKWENQLVISEGDYGKWFPIEETFALENLIFEDKVILNDLERSLLNGQLR